MTYSPAEERTEEAASSDDAAPVTVLVDRLATPTLLILGAVDAATCVDENCLPLERET
jgi:hypothetical protein